MLNELARTADDDSRWFRRNLRHRERLRPYRPGEFGPVQHHPPPPGWRAMVLVRQLAPGLRTRAALVLLLRRRAATDGQGRPEADRRCTGLPVARSGLPDGRSRNPRACKRRAG